MSMNFMHSGLVYIVRRPEVQLSEIQQKGFNTIDTLLKQFRSVMPEFLYQFYEYFSHLNRNVVKYISLEESVTKSGHYEKDRQVTLSRILEQLAYFGDDENKDVVLFMTNMLKK